MSKEKKRRATNKQQTQNMKSRKTGKANTK